MYSRALRSKAHALASAAAPATARPFSVSAATALRNQKAPALADISPGEGKTFEAKKEEWRSHQQQEFDRKRADEIAKREAKKEAASGSSTTTSAPAGSADSQSILGKSIGSLSSTFASDAREQDGKKPSALSSLIYGTPEGRELDKDIERSFSQVLARGKYVHSIVFHDVKPDKVEEYTELVGSWYPRMASMPDNKVHLVGSWRTEVGECDTFVHIWEYQRYSGYHSSLNKISQHPEFQEFDTKLKKLINSKKTSLMQEFSFWPTTSPRKLGGLFELRSYTLHPGNLLEWETHWRKGLHARREVMEGVGAWFVQIGELNTVHHLWQFADLEERKVRREKSWGQEGWGETVHKTVPLIQTMKSRILIPCEWSPVA